VVRGVVPVSAAVAHLPLGHYHLQAQAGHVIHIYIYIYIYAISDEKESHIEELKKVKAEFEKAKSALLEIFEPEAATNELKRVNKHMEKVKEERKRKHDKKLPNADHNDVLEENFNQTIETENVTPPGRAKKRRRFKRIYLQPQPKKSRKRKRKPLSSETLPAGWNDVLKNLSDEPISEVEKALFMKGKKFCPIERDPPILRMQRELNSFFRTLRLQWFFRGQMDGRAELEKKFYNKSNWNPPKAYAGIERMISRLQEKFDQWKPSRFVKDNLSKREREFLSNISEESDIMY
jgi:hypothetical protein